VRAQKGFGLIEVLVTFSIMSVALIGMTKIVLLSQHTTTDNALRTQALILGQDMVGRILANSANSRACTLSDYHTLGASGATLQADNIKCYGDNSGKCTPIQVAQQDIRDWKNMVQGTTDASSPGTITQGLPSGVGVVCCTDNLNGGSATDYTCPNITGAPSIAAYAIKVHWTGVDGSAHRIVLAAVP
jgi:type IV pilus modification protein PilV